MNNIRTTICDLEDLEGKLLEVILTISISTGDRKEMTRAELDIGIFGRITRINRSLMTVLEF